MADAHIAQLNIALPRQPLDSPELAEFMALLDPVNALADAAPGFVWGLQDESGDATSIRAFEDERLIVNMSVWETIEALWEFVYSGRHLEVMRRRREWTHGPTPRAFTFKRRFPASYAARRAATSRADSSAW